MDLYVAIAISTGLSTVAIAVAVFAAVTARRLTRWQSWPYDEITRLQASSDDHEVQLAQHHERLRKMNARLAARARRGQAEPVDEELPNKTPADSSTGFARQPGESDAEWKARMRKKIVTGEIKHG